MLANHDAFLARDRPVIDGEYFAPFGILFQCKNIDCLKFLLFCSCYQLVLVLWNITQ